MNKAQVDEWRGGVESRLEELTVMSAKQNSDIENVEGIVIKLIDRFNKSDENTANHRIDIVKELNDVTDGLSYLKGRINGKS